MERVFLTIPRHLVVKHIEEEFYLRYPTARIAWDECYVDKDAVIVVGYIDEGVQDEMDGTRCR